MLLEENRFLRGSLHASEARADSSFTDGYFTTSYEVAEALSPFFDMQAALNWDRVQIMVKATRFSKDNLDQRGPS